MTSDPPMMLRDLAMLSGITAAQAHAYLVSLRKLDLVERDPATGRYRLGSFALQLGLSRLRTTSTYQLASEALPSFADRLGMMATITVWGSHGPTVVHVHESANQLHVNVKAGTVFSLTGTATGKLFAALAPSKKVDSMVRAEIRSAARSQRVAESVTIAEMREIIAMIRKSRYATTNDRPVPGISAIAAPVVDHTEQLQLAVTLIAPSRLIDTSDSGPHVRELLHFTGRLSERLGSRSAVPVSKATRKRAPRGTSR